MGLDMYVYKSKTPPPRGKANGRDDPHVNKEYIGFDWERFPAEEKAKYYDSTDDEEIFYWRGFDDLHKHFEMIFRAHGGEATEFPDHLKYYAPTELTCSLCDKTMDVCNCDHEAWEKEHEYKPLYFNMHSLELDEKDIDMLERMLTADLLSPISDEDDLREPERKAFDNAETKKFIKIAKQALADGFYLYYTSSW